MNIDTDRWHTVCARDGGKCQYCGMNLLQDFHHYHMAQVDHIKHRSIGGGDELENLVLACMSCNSRLSRASKLQTLDERREHLKTSSKGTKTMYNKYISEGIEGMQKLYPIDKYK